MESLLTRTRENWQWFQRVCTGGAGGGRTGGQDPGLEEEGVNRVEAWEKLGFQL